MKASIKTNKLIVAVCILTLALLVFPLSSVAKGGKGHKKGHKKGANESFICAFEGDIAGLEFDFGDGFPFNLGEMLEVTILRVEVKASGYETAVITPPHQYTYNAILSGGVTDSEGGHQALGELNAVAELNMGRAGSMDVILKSKFVSANLFEQFKIKKRDIPDSNADINDACEDLFHVAVPKKVDLFFEVKEVQLTGITDLKDEDITLNLMSTGFNPGDIQPFNLLFVIAKGKLILVDNTFEFFIP